MPVRAFVFPGQGSQAVGMGAALDAFRSAREVFEEVDDALGQHLTRLMREGPVEELTLTENAQPALMAHSVAVLRVLEREGGFDLAARVALVAGHSLGEYSALTAARAFPLPTAARLLRLRGEAMQRATPPGTGWRRRSASRPGFLPTSWPARRNAAAAYRPGRSPPPSPPG